MRYFYFTLVVIGTSFASVFAQPEFNPHGFFDDFSTKAELETNPTTHTGIFWWGTDQRHLLTRDAANKRLIVKMFQPEYSYDPFGVNFGDSNGSKPGGVDNTIDISGNGKFSFDIINTDTVGLGVRVLCQDINGYQVDCTKGALSWNDVPNHQTQIQVPAGETITFKAGTPNGAGGGVVNDCDFTTGFWGDYGTHTMRNDCDLTKIVSIHITVLNSAKNNYNAHALALPLCQFAITNFKVGEVISGLEKTVSNSEIFSVFPNPANQTITITYNLLNSAPVSITNAVGHVVYSNSTTLKESIIDVSNFQTGLYYVKIGSQIKKVVVQN